jgi:cell wall-associated NlpC family hydrolase
MVAVAAAAIVTGVAAPPAGAHGSAKPAPREAARLDAANLRLAARAVEGQAIASGVLRHPIHRSSPAVVLLRTDVALIHAAVHRDPRRRPVDTRAVMGPVPYNLAHHIRHRPGHLRIRHTRALRRFGHRVPVGGSSGIGWNTRFRNSHPAPFQKPDGVYVVPRLPRLHHPTVSEVALRTAMKQLGRPYVWGGAGPSTFDCSGLTMRAYARGGVRLTHFTGSQWNQGRMIPARDALPGDLILFGHSVFHVAMYLGAGWMLNAPFTGHYVDVTPVWRHVAGVIRP